ncbi:MAG: GtrA family protein [Gammaproteobacteria bacterium]
MTWGGLIRIVTPKSETSSLVSKTAAAQLLKYLTVGVLSAGLETTLFWWLFRQLHIAWVVANSLAIFITFWFNFSLNRLWSFQSRGLLARQLVLYVALFCFNLVMSNLIIYVLADKGRLDYIVAKLISIALIVAWNFVLYKTVIYRR